MFAPRVLSLLSIFFAIALGSDNTTYTGTLFYFEPGLGTCGFTNTSSEIVGSVSTKFFNDFPGATPDPKINPICNRKVLVTHGDKSVIAAIVDAFTDPEEFNVGLSPAAFEKIAPISEGIVHDVVWSVID